MIYSYQKFENLIIEISYENKTLYSLSFVDDIPKTNTQTEFSIKVFTELSEYFTGKRKSFDISLHIEGTNFQKRVWEELLKIPYGTTKSYKEIAEAIGNPKASRAIGNANNKNKIAILIPCHRVVGSNGDLVGYAGGLGIKEILLNKERA